MTRYAIGDVQGCHAELKSLLKQIGFRSECDRLWFVGDLVNRGPDSLETLRFVRALGENATVVLGNHDLHLLAVAAGVQRLKRSDTLEPVLGARDREGLLEWLTTRPLAYAEGDDLLVHAGLIPPWSAALALALAQEVSGALARDARGLFEHMYGNTPERWDAALSGYERLRFTINVLTRLRLCSADGRIDVSLKGPPPSGDSALRPWFEHRTRLSRAQRVIFGHWSALGLVQRCGVVGLDTGCVWGGALTAFDLDHERAPLAVPCREYQAIEA